MWKRIASVGLSMITLLSCGLGGETLPGEPDAAQRAAMQTPDGTVRQYYDSLIKEQYTAVAPLLADDYRAQLIREGNGKLSSFYQAGATYSGGIGSYTIDGQRDAGTSAEVDVSVASVRDPQYPRLYTVDLIQGAAGWQISYVRNR